MPGAQISFPPFRLDLGNACLWHGTQAIALQPKDFAVLHCLLEHPGQLVTKEVLLDTVWPGTAVSEGVLKVCIRRIRRALGDAASMPQFIKTVHRRGYRFIAPLSPSSESRVLSAESLPTPNPQFPIPNLVGRENELQHLHSWFGQAKSGSRQVVFITGEAGIGKTTLVEAFLDALNQTDTLLPIWVGRGQCIEQHGAGEAYMPVLEALERLCRRSDGERLLTVLDQHAPTWLVQLPSLIEPVELEALQRRIQGVTRERMLREMAKAVEIVTAEVTLVLVLEDLQWSDHSTISLLSVLAHRQEATRLFVLGTYRPADMVAGEHSLPGLKQELQMHGHCEELPLTFLSEAAVGEYVARQFSVDEQTCARLTELIHTRTDGNPLFLVNLLDYLVAQGNLLEVNGQWQLQAGLASIEEIEEGQEGVPDNLRHMIEKQIERLSAEEQRLLEIASVAGVEFSAAALDLSDAGGEGTVEAEESCEALARQGKFLRANGWDEWPDGTVAGRYQFIHSLYQNVLYNRIPAGRRLQLHRTIGEREERGYGQRVAEVAAELAIHFEHGHVLSRAVYYLQRAADNALQRCAYQEAIRQLSHGLSLVQEHDSQSGNSVSTSQDTSEHTRQEIALSLTLGIPLAMTKGYAAPEVEQTYSHARDLCEKLGETPQLFRALRGLRAVSLTRAEFTTARHLGEQLLMLAERQNDPTLLLSAHDALGITYFHTGDLIQARSHLEHGLALYDPQKRRPNGFVQDPGMVCLLYSAFSLCVLGSFGQARDTVQQALSLARDLAHPHSLAYAFGCAAIVSHMCRDEQAAQAFAEETIVLSTEQGFAYWLAMGTILHGGIEQILNGLAAWRATGAEAMRPYYLSLLADAYVKAGQAQEGLQVVAEALELVETTEERFCEAELYRLKGEGLLAQEMKNEGAKDSLQSSVFSLQLKEAEECFEQAIAIARRQQTKLWELRAVLSVSRLWQMQGKRTKACDILRETIPWFETQAEIADLQEAKVLLAQIS